MIFEIHTSVSQGITIVTVYPDHREQKPQYRPAVTTKLHRPAPLNPHPTTHREKTIRNVFTVLFVFPTTGIELRAPRNCAKLRSRTAKWKGEIYKQINTRVTLHCQQIVVVSQQAQVPPGRSGRNLLDT